MKRRKRRHSDQVKMAHIIHGPDDSPVPNLDLRYAQSEADLAIDKHKLDEALIIHPLAVAKVGETFAEVVSYRDQAVDDLKTLEANLDAMIRRAAKEKPTEPQIKSQIARDKDRIRAEHKVIDLTREVNRWSSLHKAIMERGYVIRQLCELWARDYFAISSVKGEAVSNYSQDAYDKNRADLAKQRKDRNRNRD